MDNCIFCKIISDSSQSFVVYEDENFLAFLDIFPINEGHTLLIPKKHEEFIWGLDSETYSTIFTLAKKLSNKLQMALNPKTVALAVEGLTVPHTHIHLVPVHGQNELNPMRAKKVEIEDLRKTMEKISQV